MKTKFKLQASGEKQCVYPTPSFLPSPTNSVVAVDVPVATTLDISPNPAVVENVDAVVDDAVVAAVALTTDVPAEVVPVADNSIEAPTLTATNDPVISTLDDGTVTVTTMDSGDMFASSGTSAFIPFNDADNPVVAPASIDGSATSDITGAPPMVGTDESIGLGAGSTSDDSLAAVSLFPADPALGNSSSFGDVDCATAGSIVAAPPADALVDPNVTAVDPMTGATDESMLALI